MKNPKPIITNGLTGLSGINSIVMFGITTNPVAKNIVPTKNNNANFLDLFSAIRKLSPLEI